MKIPESHPRRFPTAGSWLFLIACGVLLFAGFRVVKNDDPIVSDIPTANQAGQSWHSVYNEASLEQIKEEIDALNRYLYEETHAYYEEQFRTGNYEFVPDAKRPDGTFDLSVGDDLAAWRVMPSGQLARVTLPVEGFEEAYEAQHRISSLLLKERERYDALAIAAK